MVWSELLNKTPADLSMPKGTMKPSGYVVMQHGILEMGPVKSYKRWMDRIPQVYREAVLEERVTSLPQVANDPYCLSLLKHYRSLMPMAMEVRKPIFFLKSADGAIGAHMEAVKSCYSDFQELARKIALSTGMALPLQS